MYIIYEHVKVENMDCKQCSVIKLKYASLSGELCGKGR